MTPTSPSMLKDEQKQVRNDRYQSIADAVVLSDEEYSYISDKFNFKLDLSFVRIDLDRN